MTHSPQPPHDPIDEREWALQEHALRAERLGLDPAADAELARYRSVMQALRAPLKEQLPDDFAASVARMTRQRPVNDMRLELWLSNALLGLLGAMLVVLLIMYGPAWLQQGQVTMETHALANPWLLALLIGMALPAALGKLIPHRTSSDHDHPG